MERVWIINEYSPTNRLELAIAKKRGIAVMVDLSNVEVLRELGISGSGTRLKVGAYNGRFNNPHVLLENSGDYPIDIRKRAVDLPAETYGDQNIGWIKVRERSSVSQSIRDNPLGINLREGTLVISWGNSL